MSPTVVNKSQLENIPSMLVTLPVFHFPISSFVKDLQSLNIFSMFVTLDVSQSLISPNVVNELHSQNILCILQTLPVFHLLRSSVFNEWH